ncbi:MAG: UrcA family protein [Erythrobacter sp.]
MKFFTLASIALAPLALAVAPGSAADAQHKSIQISTDDLDLSTAKGQRTLDRRIEKAARSVCDAGHSRTGTRIRSTSVSKCLDVARNSVREQVAARIESQSRGI